MSSSCFYCSRKIAYLALNRDQRSNEAKLKSIQDYCSKLPYEVDIFAEEPSDPNYIQSPLFKEILQLIAKGAVAELIIPSLAHLLGHDSKSRQEFLDFLNENHVRLVTVDEEPTRLASFFRGDI